MSKKRILSILISLVYSFCSYSQTLPAVPKRITMFDLNIVLEENTRKTIEKEMGFLASKKVYVDAKLAKMSIYFPIIETIFEQEGIPKEFKYLCAQESSFIADAVSTSNAVGFWQFKSGTAIDYGLRVDDMVDERKNIVASTRAAAYYLKKNNKTYQNWVSTLLSYRLGLTGAKNQIPADWTNASEITIGNDIDWYVIRNIAHFIYFENELAHFAPNGSYLHLYNTASGKTFSAIAEELQIEEQELRKENSWCKTDIVPSDKNYTVVKLIKKDQKVPVLAQTSAINKPFFDIEIGYPILKIDERKSKKTGNIFYTINGKDGILSIADDTPQSLAERSGLKLQYLISYNDLDKTSSIKPQMVYYLEKKNRKAKVPKHTVKKGQNVWLVSQMYGIRESRLLRLNRMKKSDALQEGRVLNMMVKRGRKEEIEFIRKPFENEQLPNEAPRIIVDNPTRTFPTKTTVPVQEIDLTFDKTEKMEASTFSEPVLTTYSGNQQMKVIVRDMGELNESKIMNSETNDVESSNSNSKYIIVKPGENLFNISKKYNVLVTDLKRTNGLVTNNVEVGQKLVLPQTKDNDLETISTTTTKMTFKNESSKMKTHIVEPGETLYRVSVIYKVSVDKLKQINQLTDNTISVGQKLIITK
ncbi:MAG: LysM peptidoglycan-binding domain-containing protein [Bacteroidota bacterium]